MFWFKFSVIGWTFFFASLATATELRRGLYLGFMYSHVPGMKVPTTIEAVPVAKVKDKDKVSTFVYFKRSYGTFISHEYFARAYDLKVAPGQKRFLLEDSSEPEFSVDLKLSDDGSRLEGEFYADQLGIAEPGRIVLVHESEFEGASNPKFLINVIDEAAGTIFPGVPVFPTITGAYKGLCRLYQGLQIEAARQNLGAFQRFRLPENQFLVTGRFLRKFRFDEELQNIGPFRIGAEFDYSIFSGRMEFADPTLGTCQLTEKGITCETCEFERLGGEGSFESVLAMNSYRRTPIVDKGTVETTELASERKVFKGHLFMESQNKRREFSIEVRRDSDGEVEIIPRLGLQDDRTTDIHERYVSMQVDKKGDANPGWLEFFSANGNLMRIHKWDDEGMTGAFYSAGFGRVGPFFLGNEAKDLPRPQYDLPGTYYSEIYKDSWTHQLIMDIEWRTNPSGFPLPHQLSGFMYHVRAGMMGGRNWISNVPLRFLGFDPFSGIFAAQVRDRNTNTFLGRLTREALHVVNLQEFAFGQGQLRHQVDVYRRNRLYVPLKIPDDWDVRPGEIHVFFPIESRLFVNDVEFPANNFSERMYKIFTTPDFGDRATVRYTFVARLRYGREWKAVMDFNVEELKRKGVIVNLFEHQGVGIEE